MFGKRKAATLDRSWMNRQTKRLTRDDVIAMGYLVLGESARYFEVAGRTNNALIDRETGDIDVID